jgi:hypothetical protein
VCPDPPCRDWDHS